jgi:hypothetical protein
VTRPSPVVEKSDKIEVDPEFGTSR